MKPVEIKKIVNLGEPGAPMNNILWTEWSGWPLEAKMGTDFPDEVLVRLDDAAHCEVIPVNGSRTPVKTTILIGSNYAGAMIATNHKTGAALVSTSAAAVVTNSKTGAALETAAGAVAATNNKTGTALASAGSAVGTSLEESKDSTGNALNRAAGRVWKALGGCGE